jgi:hypothetical protein
MASEGFVESLTTGAPDSPCGCKDKMDSGVDLTALDLLAPATESATPENLGAVLDAALANISRSREPDIFNLSIEEELEFAGIGDPGGITFEDVLAFLERNPGLKVTFSF